MKRRWSLLILLCLLLTGCSAEASGGQLISAAEGSGAYSEALLPFLPGYALRDGEDTLYAEVSRGNAVACFDVQAVPAMRRGVGRLLVSSCAGYGGVGGEPYTDRRGNHRLGQPPAQPHPCRHEQLLCHPQYAGHGCAVLRTESEGACKTGCPGLPGTPQPEWRI